MCSHRVPNVHKWSPFNRALLYTGVGLFGLGVIFDFASWAVLRGWGVAQLGPFSAWVAATATFIAVTVALIHGSRSHKVATLAIDAAERRAVVDREFEHRRQITKQFADFWADGETLMIEVTLYLRAVDPAKSPSPTGAKNAFLDVQSRLGKIEWGIYYLQTVVVQSELAAEVKVINDRYRALWEAFSGENDGVYADNIRGTLARFVARRDLSITLLRMYAPLTDAAEKEAKTIREQHATALKYFGTDANGPSGQSENSDSEVKPGPHEEAETSEKGSEEA